MLTSWDRQRSASGCLRTTYRELAALTRCPTHFIHVLATQSSPTPLSRPLGRAASTRQAVVLRDWRIDRIHQYLDDVVMARRQPVLRWSRCKIHEREREREREHLCGRRDLFANLRSPTLPFGNLDQPGFRSCGGRESAFDGWNGAMRA